MRSSGLSWIRESSVSRQRKFKQDTADADRVLMRNSHIPPGMSSGPEDRPDNELMRGALEGPHPCPWCNISTYTNTPVPFQLRPFVAECEHCDRPILVKHSPDPIKGRERRMRRQQGVDSGFGLWGHLAIIVGAVGAMIPVELAAGFSPLYTVLASILVAAIAASASRMLDHRMTNAHVHRPGRHIPVSVSRASSRQRLGEQRRADLQLSPEQLMLELARFTDESDMDGIVAALKQGSLKIEQLDDLLYWRRLVARGQAVDSGTGRERWSEALEDGAELADRWRRTSDPRLRRLTEQLDVEDAA
jgi:hypothetical protein